MAVDHLSKKRAAEFLGCSVEELLRWIPPDLRRDDKNPATRGMQLWSRATLEAAKPHVEEWRERDRRSLEQAKRDREREQAREEARLEELRRKEPQRREALLALGHSGECESHARGVLSRGSRRYLLYAKTSARLLGIGVRRLRKLVRPADWIPNPVYSSAPTIPVYDPCDLLFVKRFIDSNDKDMLANLEKFVSNATEEDYEALRKDYGMWSSFRRYW